MFPPAAVKAGHKPPVKKRPNPFAAGGGAPPFAAKPNPFAGGSPPAAPPMAPPPMAGGPPPGLPPKPPGKGKKRLMGAGMAKPPMMAGW